MAISQLGVFNTLMYYAATLFSIVGFNNPTAVGITVSSTKFVFSWVNLVPVDKFGRRIILTITVLGMSICMMVAVVAFQYIPVNTNTLALETNHIGWPGHWFSLQSFATPLASRRALRQLRGLAQSSFHSRFVPWAG